MVEHHLFLSLSVSRLLFQLFFFAGLCGTLGATGMFIRVESMISPGDYWEGIQITCLFSQELLNTQNSKSSKQIAQ